MPTKIIATVAATTTLFCVSLVGCGASSASGDEIPSPDYSYETQGVDEATGLTIATVEPKMVNTGEIPPEPPAGTPAFAVTADGYTVEAQMQIGLMNHDDTSEQFATLFRESHSAKLQRAASKTITRILENKGFEAQPVDAYDEVVDGANAQGFLTSLPNYTLGLGNKTKSVECVDNVCTQTGELLIDGQYLYQLAEPHTGTTVAYRRMNLYGLRIAEPYTIQTYKQAPGLLTRAKQLFGLEDALVNTSKQAMADGLTKLYQQTMGETERTISRPQILALKDRITQLKNSPAP